MTAAWRKARRFIVHSILHADDTPHRIAIGVAAGLFAGFLPAWFFQTVLAIAFAALLRGNKIVAIPMVWITNPFTFIPIYALCIRVGHGLMGTAPPAELAVPPDNGPMQQILANGLGTLLESGFWYELLKSLTRIGGELWIGCILVGFIFATTGYFATRWAVIHYRGRRRLLLAELAARRAARRSARHMAKQLHTQKPLA